MAPIASYASRYRIPLSLAQALIGQESGGHAGAVSPAGAVGLTQVMPETAAGMYGISPSEAAQRLRDPEFALDAGMRYLAEQKKKFGSWRLALAAYNAGPGAVEKYGGVPPFEETQNYVRSILGKTGALPSGATGTAPEAPLPTAPMGNAGSTPAASTPLLDTHSELLQGLQSLYSGQYDPQQRLQGLQALQQQLSGGETLSTPAPPGTQNPQTPNGGQTTPTVLPTVDHGQALDGKVSMVTGGKAPYSNLAFAGHTDWHHVNPTLLAKINSVLKAHGMTGEVISGYRSNDYSDAVGGFRGDPHTKGIAVDVYVNGQPVGKVLGADVWKQAGIRSGDTFSYQGSPDYEHLDLVGYGY